jgi:lipoprotein-anchoring transpeptidase ErfK/SrfK
MPTYKVGRRRLYLGAWKHGVSIYGAQGHDARFVSRHPGLKTSKGTIRLRPEDAAGIPDEELGGLVRAALDA